MVFLPSFPLYAQTDYCNIAKTAIKDASRLRGLAQKKQVPCLVHDRDKVKDYLLTTISTKLPEGKLKMEEYVYKSLGMVPDKFDYEHGLVDLYLSQIGGYYDPEKKHFIMAAWMPAILQTTVAVHELTHGLQDQYFDLEKLIDAKLDNGDVLLARSALVEGDANIVMLDHARELAGQGRLVKEKDVDSFLMQNIVGLSLMAGMSQVPESLQMVLIFPYTSGVRFVHFLQQHGGYVTVNKAFSRLPRSSEEILHPEKYMAETPDFKEFSEADLLAFGAKPAGKLIYQDTMGEFSISALLGNYVKDKRLSSQAASGWGGDRIFVYEEEGERSLYWLSNWDSEKDAEEFSAQYFASLKSRYPDKEGVTSSADSYKINDWGRGERRGSAVLIEVR